MPIKYEELVKTVVFDVIAADDGGLIYRLEVFKSDKGFKGQLLRRETYSLQCSFAEYKPDESIYVLDSHSHSIDLDGKLFDHPQSCVDFVANALEEKFKKE